MIHTLTAALRARGSSAFVRNLGALGAGQIAMRVSRLLTTVVLSRLLLPNDFGLAAIVLTVWEIVGLFTRNGIAAKVAQVEAADLEAVAHTARTLIWIVCAILVALQLLIAVPVALTYHDTRLALPIALMAVVYFVPALCDIQGAMLMREGRLGRIALAGAVQVTTDNLLTALLAVCGLGMWAIVLPKILVAPIWVIGIRTGHAWRPTRGFSLAGWREIARFGRDVGGVELLTTLQANVDNLIVAACLGVEALGFYYFAFNAGLGITLGFVNAFSSAVYSHLCQVRADPEQLSRRYRQSLRTLGGLLVPVVLLQVLAAPFYVPIVFGARWTPAIPVLMLICASALARPFAATCSQLLKAVGRPDIELRWQAALSLVLVAALLAGTHWGIVGVAAAVLVVQATFLTAYAVLVPGRFLRPARSRDENNNQDALNLGRSV